MFADFTNENAFFDEEIKWLLVRDKDVYKIQMFTTLFLAKNILKHLAISSFWWKSLILQYISGLKCIVLNSLQ